MDAELIQELLRLRVASGSTKDLEQWADDYLAKVPPERLKTIADEVEQIPDDQLEEQFEMGCLSLQNSLRELIAVRKELRRRIESN